MGGPFVTSALGHLQARKPPGPEPTATEIFGPSHHDRLGKKWLSSLSFPLYSLLPQFSSDHTMRPVGGHTKGGRPLISVSVHLDRGPIHPQGLRPSVTLLRMVWRRQGRHLQRQCASSRGCRGLEARDSKSRHPRTIGLLPPHRDPYRRAEPIS